MKKLMKKKGFTLAELLIVVAIIAVLVAVSIPIFTSKLESSREAVDISNMRSAYAIASADLLTGSYDDTDVYTAGVAYYNPTTGKLQKTKVTCSKATKAGIQGSTPEWDGTTIFNYDGGGATAGAIKVTLTTTAGSEAVKVEMDRA